ncbi:hydroxymethylglutaryl-CoA reductase, degradative [candidate division KSB1 bacterium]|nr:hydroxymethylglutaryl-CoA reductase, degradative [candidate division KSB1 bacterium]
MKEIEKKPVVAEDDTKHVNGRSSRFSGFYKLDVDQRLQKLNDEWYRLSTHERWMLKRETLTPDLGDVMVENSIGVFSMPLGIAVNFQINGKDYVVPMAIEETSVIAAASNSARLIRENGELTAIASEQVMISQIQIVDVPKPELAKKAILKKKKELLDLANMQDPTLLELGGGAKDIEVRIIESQSGPMVIVHILVDTRDAMGANAVNTMAEALGPIVAELAEGDVICKIVSNLSDHRTVKVKFVLNNVECLARAGYTGDQAANRIVKAYHFADADPHRAATHNKGVMNGIDGVLIATGNDWRAVEAGVHAFAARDGQYRSVSKYYRDNQGRLIGELEIPMAIGIVGGVTAIHPGVKILLKMMGVTTSAELAQVVAAAGLIQNFSAIWTLATEGIQKGHMTLHARNVAVFAGAIGEMAIKIANEMAHEGRVRFDRAKQLLKHFLVKELPENGESDSTDEN